MKNAAIIRAVSSRILMPHHLAQSGRHKPTCIPVLQASATISAVLDANHDDSKEGEEDGAAPHGASDTEVAPLILCHSETNTRRIIIPQWPSVSQ